MLNVMTPELAESIVREFDRTLLIVYVFGCLIIAAPCLPGLIMLWMEWRSDRRKRKGEQ
jgi:hypothetical protein